MQTDANPLKVVRLQPDEDRDRLRSAWSDLLDRSPIPSLSLTYEWQMTWWECFCEPRRELFLLAVLDHEQIIALAPLMRAQRHWAGFSYRALEFITQRQFAFSYEMMSPRLDILCSDQRQEAVQALLSYLRENQGEWDVLRLDTLSEDSPTHDLLLTEASKVGLRAVRGSEFKSFEINAPKGWDAYLAARSKHFRAHTTNQQTRFRSHGTVEVEHVTAAEDPAATFARILDVEGRSWKWKKGLSINSVGYRDFYRRFLAVASQNGRLLLTFLKLNGRTIAFFFSAGYAGRLEALRTAYDRAYASLSPGHELFRSHFEEAMKQGWTQIHLMGGAEGYKRRWYTEPRMYLEVFIFHEGRRSRALRFGWITCRLYGRFRFIPGYFKRVMRKLGVPLPWSELTRTDQVK